VLALKRLALGRPPEVRRTLADYLVPPPGKRRDGALEVHLAHRLGELEPRSGLGPYLVGKQLAGRGACREAVGPLARALSRPLPDRDFVIEALLVLGGCQHEGNDLVGADETFRRLAALPGLPVGTRREADDWLARVAWRSGRAPP
jgi:hypothetical protein